MKNFVAQQDQLIIQRLFFNKESLKSRIITSSTISRTSSEECDVIVHFGKKQKNILPFSQEYRYVSNHGCIRWMFPKGNLASALDFYPVSSFRSRMIKNGIRILAALHLERWVSRPITIYAKEPVQLAIDPHTIPYEQFAAFFGTPGIERTVLVSLLNHGKCSAYLKFGLNSYTQESVMNEGRILHRLEYKTLQQIEVPSYLPTRLSNVIGISKLNAKQKKSTTTFTHTHALALEELLNLSPSLERLDHSHYGESIINNISALRKSTSDVAARIYPFLNYNLAQVPHNFYFLAGTTHGDFTPWNMFLSNDKIHLYDWEKGQSAAPFLFDVFHFHFQSGIHIENWSFDQIYKRIELALNLEPLAALIQLYNIDPFDYLRLYLLHTVSEKAIISIVEQDKSDVKLSAEFAVWEQALKFTIPITEKQRALFITDFNKKLNSLEHAFLKFDAKSFDNLLESSDLDIAISPLDVQKAVQFCQNHGFVLRSRVITKSFMTTVLLFFKNGDFLSIDLIHEFKRKYHRFMEIRPLILSATRNKFGIMVPEMRYDLEYTVLFYVLNHSEVPLKYQTFFKTHSTIDKTRSLNYLSHKYGIEEITLTNLFDSIATKRTEIKKNSRQKNQLSIIDSLHSLWNYAIDTLTDFTLSKGFVITVSGVDGVGKTSVINALKDKIQLKYRKEVVLLRHRPHLLPILSTFKYGSAKKAEALATYQQPNLTTKKNRLSSSLRFAYYLMDYLLGQGYIYFRYILRGKIVLYDRYYFDMINHPERTNLSIKKGLAKWFYRWLKNPSLNILLHAPTELIYQRKQELNPATIEQLNSGYLDLFSEFSKKYHHSFFVVENDQNIDATITTILTRVQKVA